jgi:NitT/TauT family transport system substrate-binding protein
MSRAAPAPSTTKELLMRLHPGFARTLVATMAALVLSGPSSSAPVMAADPPVTLHVGAGANDTVSNLFYAIQNGYFKARNLDVQVQLMTSGASEAAALAGGALDIVESNVVSTSAAHLRGIPFVYIAPGAEYTTAAPTSEMVCAKTSQVRSGKDFAGKSVAVVALGDLSQLGPEVWIDATGGDLSTVHYIEMPATAMPAAIARGTVESGLLPEPALQIALASGASKVCGKVFDMIAPQFMLNGWITTTDWLKKNPDVARRFREAMLEGAKWGNKNHKASAEIFKQYSKAPPEVIDVMTRATFAERLDPELLQPVINVAAKYKFLDKAFPASDIIAP